MTFFYGHSVYSQYDFSVDTESNFAKCSSPFDLFTLSETATSTITCLFLSFLDAVVSLRRLRPVWFFSLTLVYVWINRGSCVAASQREGLLKCSPVFMFVSGFTSLYPQQQALWFLQHFFPTCNTHPCFQMQFMSVQNEPVFPTLSLSMYTCQTLLSGLCLCSSLGLVAWSFWMLSRRNSRQVEHIWAQIQGWKEKSSCGTAYRIFHGNSQKSQTSVQVLSRRLLVQSHAKCILSTTRANLCVWESF